LGAGLGGFAIAVQAFGEAPDPDGRGRGGETEAYFTQHSGDALLFGGADVGEGASGVEGVAQLFGGAAFVFDGQVAVLSSSYKDACCAGKDE
jgi:hypothetical protein